MHFPSACFSVRQYQQPGGSWQPAVCLVAKTEAAITRKCVMLLWKTSLLSAALSGPSARPQGVCLSDDIPNAPPFAVSNMTAQLFSFASFICLKVHLHVHSLCRNTLSRSRALCDAFTVPAPWSTSPRAYGHERDGRPSGQPSRPRASLFAARLEDVFRAPQNCACYAFREP